MILTLFRTDPDGTIRYYSLHDRQPLLTARYALTIAWRTGEGREREKVYGFDTLAEMDRKIRELFGRRVKKGYKLLYSFMRDRPASAAPDSTLAAQAIQAKSG
jgi:predicted DNA-binding WGR domain protein